jgi:hypothetical protein
LQFDNSASRGAIEDGNTSLFGRPILPGPHELLARLAELLLGRFEVAATLHQGLFTFHHGQLRLVAQLLDNRSGNFCHSSLNSYCTSLRAM